MLAMRRARGWSIADAAKQLGVDEGTWGNWERTGHIAWDRYRLIIEAFLAAKNEG